MTALTGLSHEDAEWAAISFLIDPVTPRIDQAA